MPVHPHSQPIIPRICRDASKTCFSKIWNTCHVITLGRACCMHVFEWFSVFLFWLPDVAQTPSYCQHQFGRRQSCLGETTGRTVQHEHCPWFLEQKSGWWLAGRTVCNPQTMTTVLKGRKKFNGMINAPTVCMDPTAWFQIHQYCTWHITSTSCFVEVYINTFLSQSENFFGRH